MWKLLWQIWTKILNPCKIQPFKLNWTSDSDMYTEESNLYDNLGLILVMCLKPKDKSVQIDKSRKGSQTKKSSSISLIDWSGNQKFKRTWKISETWRWREALVGHC